MRHLSLAILWIIALSLAPLAHGAELDDIRAAIRSRGASWTAGETSVMKEPAEARQRRLGLMPPLVATEQEHAAADWAETAKAASLPREFDWRDYGGNFVTPVRDQGSLCASCWAFGATAALEAAHLRAAASPGIDLNLAEQILVSCGGPLVGNCSGGYMDGTSDFFVSTGLPSESFYPYAGIDSPCGFALENWRSSVYKATGWTFVTASEPTVEAIKAALVAYGPLVGSMRVYNDFFAYTSGVYTHSSGSFAGFHAPLIIGYSDAGQYFTAKNSWGAAWGESGFFKIAYSELSTVTGFGSYTIAYVTGRMDLLTVSKTGEGAKGGKVTASGPLWRGQGNSGRYPEGTIVTVTARGSANSVFDGWSGCDAVSGATCEVAMTGDRAVTASFQLPAKLSVTPGSLSFGSVKMGVGSQKSLTVRNTGTGELSVDDVSVSGTNASDFSIANSCTAAVQPGGTCTIDVSLTAASYGRKSARMRILSNDPRRPSGLFINLTGNALPPRLSVSPGAINFGAASIGSAPITRTVIVRNTGLSDLMVSSSSISGTNLSDFTLSGSCAVIPAVQTGGGSCVLGITFSPGAKGLRTGRLEITSNDPARLAKPLSVNLTGRGK